MAASRLFFRFSLPQKGTREHTNDPLMLRSAEAIVDRRFSTITSFPSSGTREWTDVFDDLSKSGSIGRDVISALSKDLVAA